MSDEAQTKTDNNSKTGENPDDQRKIEESELAVVVLNTIRKKGWKSLTLNQISTEGQISLSCIHEHVVEKYQCLDLIANYFETETKAFLEDVDQENSTENNQHTKPNEPQNQDRLFEAFMARFDAMDPHKDALRILHDDLITDPQTLTFVIPHGLNRIKKLAHLGGYRFTGPFAALQLRAFSLLYLRLIQIWFQDTSPDKAKTMAESDKAIKTYMPCLYDPCKIINLF